MKSSHESSLWPRHLLRGVHSIVPGSLVSCWSMLRLVWWTSIYAVLWLFLWVRWLLCRSLLLPLLLPLFNGRVSIHFVFIFEGLVIESEITHSTKVHNSPGSFGAEVVWRWRTRCFGWWKRFADYRNVLFFFFLKKSLCNNVFVSV